MAFALGENVGKSGKRRVRWSKALRRAFLDRLAATCNVKESAEAIGVDPYSVYYLRRRDARFAEEWGEALALGYQMLETRLVGHALAGKGTAEAIERDGLGAIDTHLALTMLAAHRNAMAGVAPKGGPKLKQVSGEEATETMLRHLDAIDRRRAGTGQ